MLENETVLRLRKQCAPIFRALFCSFRVPGILDRDDIEQEALILMCEVAEEVNADLHPRDFLLAFRRRVFYELHDILKYHLREKRSFRRLRLEGDLNSEQYAEYITGESCYSEEQLLCRDAVDYAMSMLREPDRAVLLEILHPSFQARALFAARRHRRHSCHSGGFNSAVLTSVLGRTEKSVAASLARIRLAILRSLGRLDLLQQSTYLRKDMLRQFPKVLRLSAAQFFSDPSRFSADLSRSRA